MGWLLSLFTGQIGNILLKLAPYILGVLVVLGAYFYGRHAGTEACHAKELQAVIDAQNAKLAELQQQYKDAQIVIGALTKQNGQIADVTRTISIKIGKLKNPKGCVINKDVIDLVNQARSGEKK